MHKENAVFDAVFILLHTHLHTFIEWSDSFTKDSGVVV